MIRDRLGVVGGAETNETAVESSAGAVVDEGLRCPGCDYNLTGLTGSRCPECGREYDRDQLLAAIAESGFPIPIWDQRSQIGIVRVFVSTVLAVWLHPRRFMRQLPTQPNSASRRLFRAAVYVVVSIIAIIGIVLCGDGQKTTFLGVLLLLPAWIFGAFLSEIMLAGILAEPDSQRRIGSGPFHDYWDCVLALMSSHMIHGCIAAIVYFGFPSIAIEIRASVVAASVLFWWVELGLIIHQGFKPLTDVILVWALGIPVLTAFSFIIGIVTYTMLALPVMILFIA